MFDHGNCHRHFPFDISYGCGGVTAPCALWSWCERVRSHIGDDRASRKRGLMLMCHGITRHCPGVAHDLDRTDCTIPSAAIAALKSWICIAHILSKIKQVPSSQLQARPLTQPAQHHSYSQTLSQGTSPTPYPTAWDTDTTERNGSSPA